MVPMRVDCHSSHCSRPDAVIRLLLDKGVQNTFGRLIRRSYLSHCRFKTASITCGRGCIRTLKQRPEHMISAPEASTSFPLDLTSAL
eukprot:131578-Rhodomonas_salina.1